MVDPLKGITHVVSTQVISRSATFLVNVFVARIAGPTAYGLGFVSLQLLSNLSLFATKEGFRKVALRMPEEADDVPHVSASAQNLGSAGSLAALASSVLLTIYWLCSPPEAATSSFLVAIVITAVASVVEALAEPLVIQTFLALDFRGRAMGEGAAMIVRTKSMVLFSILLDDVPLAFALAQMFYAISWTGWFVWFSGSMPRKPTRLPETGNWLLSHHYQLLGQFGSMVGLKLLLTEGEKFLLLGLFAEKDWGVFGLVSNLGSIIVRLFFAPCEEIAYSCFSAKVAQPSEEWALLRALLMLQGLFGWLGLCFGPGYSELAVRILYGQDWAASGAPTVLAAYCVLLFFMAVNGIMEAYMYAACSPEWMRQCRLAQCGVSAMLVLTAWNTRTYGSIGLVWANCISMVLRVAICAVFTQKRLSLTIAQLRLIPVCKLFGLLAISGLLCSRLVPPLPADGSLPYKQVAVAILAAVFAIAATGLCCRQELRTTLAQVRRQKAD